MKMMQTVAAAAALVGSMSAQASLISLQSDPTILLPTDGSVNFQVYTEIGADMSYTIGIFDKDDSLMANNLNVEMSFHTTIEDYNFNPVADLHTGLVTFSPWGTSSASYTVMNESGTASIDLGATMDFIVAISTDNGLSWITNSDFIASSNGEMGKLIFDIPMGDNDVRTGVIAIDVEMSPVPVPAAVWLFATGLVGLAGVARRKA